MMKGQNISATKLRIIFACSLLAIALITIAFVMFADGELKKYASEVSRIRSDSSTSSDNIDRLNKIQQELLKYKDTIERTNEIVADSQSYQYQDQIITDITSYAAKANLSVTNIDFVNGTASTNSAVTPPATGGAGTTTAAPSGVKSTAASITIKNPIVYEDLLRFIKSIEENLTKMQISRVGFAKDASGNVTSDALNIEVYIR